MQALSISLSSAGRGDDKSVSSSASAEGDESRVPFAEDSNFSDSFEAATLKTETTPEDTPLGTATLESNIGTPTLETNLETSTLEETNLETSTLESPALESKDILGRNDTDTSIVAALAPADNITIPNTPPQGETLSDSSREKSTSVIKPQSKDGTVPDVFGKQNTDDTVKPANINASDATKTAQTQTQTAQSDIKQSAQETHSDPDSPQEHKKNEAVATKATAELNINSKTIENGVPEESPKNIPRFDKTLPISEMEAPLSVKELPNLTEADSIENALKKQVDQKGFSQADFFGANSDGSIKSGLLQTTSAGTNGIALTTSLTAPTLSSSFSPNIQMIAANASTAVASFNAVSQAILVANETAKGVTVQLDPPEMGRVYIDFTFDSDDQVNVVVKSELPQSHLMLRERSEQFLGFLKDSGLENVNLSFEQNGQNNESGFNNQESSKPLYFSMPSEDPLAFNSPTRTLSNDVQTYDGLDLRL